MTDLQKFQRATRVFLARLLMFHSEDAPEVLRRIANELEQLEAGRIARSARHSMTQVGRAARLLVGTGRIAAATATTLASCVLSAVNMEVT